MTAYSLMVICVYSKKTVWQLNCDSHTQHKAVSVLRAEPITTLTTATDSTTTVQRSAVQHKKVPVQHEVSNTTVTLEPTARRLPYESPTPHIRPTNSLFEPSPQHQHRQIPQQMTPPFNTAHQRTPTAVLAHTLLCFD